MVARYGAHKGENAMLERRIAAAIRYMRQFDAEYADWAEANYRRMLGHTW